MRTPHNCNQNLFADSSLIPSISDYDLPNWFFVWEILLHNATHEPLKCHLINLDLFFLGLMEPALDSKYLNRITKHMYLMHTFIMLIALWWLVFNTNDTILFVVLTRRIRQIIDVNITQHFDWQFDCKINRKNIIKDILNEN